MFLAPVLWLVQENEAKENLISNHAEVEKLQSLLKDRDQTGKYNQ